MENENFNPGVGYRLLIPSGRCPVELEGTDIDSLKRWVKRLTEVKPRDLKYDPQVYRYWVRHTYDINSPEYKQAQNNLNCILDD